MISGVDVSKWQIPKYCNWPKIAETQQFCIARATYGTVIDPTFTAHITGARSAGMVVGAYHFYRQTEDCARQLKSFLEVLDYVQYGDSCLIPALDIEENKNYDGHIMPDKYNKDCEKIAKELRNKFGNCLLYFSPSMLTVLHNPSWFHDYPWWIADYNKTPEPKVEWSKWVIWQYTGKGMVEGYSAGVIDLNKAKKLILIERPEEFTPVTDVDIPISFDPISPRFPDDETPTKPEIGLSARPRSLPVIVDSSKLPVVQKGLMQVLVGFLSKLLARLFKR